MHTLRLLWFVPSPMAILADAWKLTSDIPIHTERNPSSDAQFDALASGQADAVVTSMDNVMDWNLRAGPQDLRIFAQMEQTTPLTLVGQKGRGGLETLRGATILVDAPRNGFVVALRAMLAEHQVGPDAYAMEPVGGVKERFDALMAGRGDATLLGPPFDGMALQAGLSRMASVQEHYPTFPGQGLVASIRAADRFRPALSAWLNALDIARQRMVREPDAAWQALALSGLPAPAVEAMVRSMADSLRPDRAGVELLIKQRRMIGLPGADTRYEQLVDTSALPPAN